VGRGGWDGYRSGRRAIRSSNSIGGVGALLLLVKSENCSACSGVIGGVYPDGDGAGDGAGDSTGRNPEVWSAPAFCNGGVGGRLTGTRYFNSHSTRNRLILLHILPYWPSSLSANFDIMW